MLKALSLRSLLVVSLVTGAVAQATPLADANSVIPLANVRAEATDLIHQGRRLLPQEVSALRDGGYDISSIDPDGTTNVWTPKGGTVVNDDAAFPIQEGETVDFYRILPSPGKMFRFIVRHTGRDRVERLYTVFLARRTQTYLVRRNLMRKLGYVVPAMKHLGNLKVQFSSNLAKENFIENKTEGLQVALLGDKEWIRNFDDKNSRIADLQDMIIFDTQEFPVNLTMGYIRPDITQGRRVINALLVPYNLVDVRESINGFRWHSAQTRSNTISLPLEDAEEFRTTMADARWIMRKILQLTRQDWQEIVSYDTGYPQPAQMLLVEKLISRRNELRRLLQMTGQDLPFNPDITSGQALVKGELTQGRFDGVAATLAHDESDSLLSPGEMTALFKSKAISSAISQLISRVNTDLIPRTDLAKAAMDAAEKRFFKDLETFIKTGKDQSSKLGIWTTPVINGNLIADREVIAGSYLGTDNRVQLADTLGVSVDAGLYFGTTGLNPKIYLAAGAQAQVTRMYAHLKPLTSIKLALEQPFKNMIIPLLRGELGDLIDPKGLAKREGEADEDFYKRLTPMLQAFKNRMGDGESLIITDSLGGGVNAAAGYGFTERIRIQAAFRASQQVISRLHILRMGDTLHVYKDFGTLTTPIHIAVTFRAGIEILGLRGQISNGTARTDFFNVNLNDDPALNPDMALVLGSIRELLIGNKTRALRMFAKPHRLVHRLNEAQAGINFLWINNLSLRNQDVVTVHREKEKRSETYVRRLIGTRTGNDYQSFAVDVVNELLKEVVSDKLSVKSTASNDPGDTLYGSSKARFGYFEGEKSSNGATYSEMFVGVTYRWKGWSANRLRLEQIVKEFSDRYNYQFYHPQAFLAIRKAELYGLNLRVMVYDQGVRRALSLSPGQFGTLLDKYSSSPNTGYPKSRFERLDNSFAWLKRKYERFSREGNLEGIGDISVRLISLLESNLNYEGFKLAVGGTRNFLIQPTLQGFFQGEDGKMAELPIEGSQLGEVGSERPYGPLTSTQLELGMIEGEFFVHWLMKKI